jgi:hypothetical protein
MIARDRNRCLRDVLFGAGALVALTGCGDGGAAKAGGPANGAPGATPGGGAATVGRTFVDVAEAAGVVAVVRSGTPEQRYIPEVKSLGVAVFDYDGDGRQDVLLTGGSTLERVAKGEPGFGCVLYRNVTPPGGPLKFEDATAAAKLPPTAWANGPCVADYDGDGDLDVFVTGFRDARLWRNRGDGTFEDATAAARIDVRGWSSGAAFGDLDGDGDLDLYVARYLRFDLADPPRHGARFTCLWKNREVLCGPRGMPAEPDVVLRNDGDGGFTDVTQAWGFAAAPPQYGLGVLIDDFDGDGRADVFVANDSSPSHLWFQREAAKFVEDGFGAGIAYAEDGGETAGMGVDAADVNGDGLPDVVVTNFEAQPNSLFVSTPTGTRLESSRAYGIALPSLPDLAWGCGFEDFDLDGDLDLFTSNGHVYPQAAEPGLSDGGYAQACRLMLRDGARFKDAGASWGAAFAAHRRVGRGAAFGDLDQDGDVDVVVVNLNDRASMFENRGPATRGHLGVRLAGVGANREALGARVRATTPDGRTVERTVRRSRSFQSSSDATLRFGLGGAAEATVDVVWPDGAREAFGLRAGGAAHVLERGKGSR